MNEPPLESFLARLYTDPEVRARFLADPLSEAEQAGLSPIHRAEVLKIDPIELRLAARSFAHKRRERADVPPAPATLVQRWIGKLRKSARRPA